MKDKKKTITIICVIIAAVILILATVQITVYGVINWNFRYTNTPEEKLLDSGILTKGSYENIGLIEIDKNNAFAVFHVDASFEEPAGVLIAHFKKSGNKFQYLGYYHFFAFETDIDEVINSGAYIETPRINGIFYNGRIKYMCGYGSFDKTVLSENNSIVTYSVDDSEFSVIYHVE